MALFVLAFALLLPRPTRLARRDPAGRRSPRAPSTSTPSPASPGWAGWRWSWGAIRSDRAPAVAGDGRRAGLRSMDARTVRSTDAKRLRGVVPGRRRSPSGRHRDPCDPRRARARPPARLRRLPRPPPRSRQRRRARQPARPPLAAGGARDLADQRVPALRRGEQRCRRSSSTPAACSRSSPWHSRCRAGWPPRRRDPGGCSRPPSSICWRWPSAPSTPRPRRSRSPPRWSPWSRSAACSASRRRGLRAVGALFALAAAVSSFLILRQAPVAPSDHARELAEIRPLVEGEKLLFLGRDNFVLYELRGSKPFTHVRNFYDPYFVEPNFELGDVGSKFDFDSVTAETLARFPYVLTTRAAYASGPPPGYEPVETTESYVLWRKGLTPLGREPARERTPAPGRVGGCPSAATRARLVVRSPRPVVAAGPEWSRPRSRAASGDRRARAARGRLGPVAPVRRDPAADPDRGAGFERPLPGNLDYRGTAPFWPPPGTIEVPAVSRSSSPPRSSDRRSPAGCSARTRSPTSARSPRPRVEPARPRAAAATSTGTCADGDRVRRGAADHRGPARGRGRALRADARHRALGLGALGRRSGSCSPSSTWSRSTSASQGVLELIELALILTLISDGLVVDRELLGRHWGPPARALVFAMPITLGLLALGAKLLFAELSLGRGVPARRGALADRPGGHLDGGHRAAGAGVDPPHAQPRVGAQRRPRAAVRALLPRPRHARRRRRPRGRRAARRGGVRRRRSGSALGLLGGWRPPRRAARGDRRATRASTRSASASPRSGSPTSPSATA